MAKFKRKALRRYASARVGRKSRRSSSRGGSGSVMSILLPAFAYGAIRPTAKQYAQPLTNMLPLGANSDEVAFGLLGYFMHKKGRGFIKNAGTAILTVEAASLGNNIVAPMVSGATGTVSGASSNANSGGWV